MAFMDEEILKQKKRLDEAKKKYESQENMEKEAESSIYDEEVVIMGKPVKFERRKIEELGISIMMPTEFFRLSDDLTRLMFPAGNPPTHLFGGEDINFQISLNHTTHKVSNDRIKDFLKLSEQMLKVAGPRVTVVDKMVEEKDDYYVGILSFVSKAVDTMVYNNQFFLTVGDSLLMGNLSFPSKYKTRFINMAKEVIMSIEKEDENGSDNPS